MGGLHQESILVMIAQQVLYSIFDRPRRVRERISFYKCSEGFYKRYQDILVWIFSVFLNYIYQVSNCYYR